MVKISLCMIVKDEEEVLGRCLNQVKGLVDEIIILDTGSQDSTREIACRYADRVEDFVWQKDLRQPEMLLLPWPKEITVCGWMLMTL